MTVTYDPAPGKVIRSGRGTSGARYQLRYVHGESGPMALYLVGPDADPFPVGAVADAANFALAVDVADEETRCLLADARRESGGIR